jgi:hypothetical protein
MAAQRKATKVPVSENPKAKSSTQKDCREKDASFSRR